MREIAAAAAMLLLTAAAPARSEPRIVGIEARLFYSASGELSKNVLDADGYYGDWNRIIADDMSGGPAEDILIVVKVGVDPPTETVVDRPLLVTVRAGKKLLAQRRFNSLLVTSAGTSAQALYLSDVGCAGHIMVAATLGRQTRRATLDMRCGE